MEIYYVLGNKGIDNDVGDLLTVKFSGASYRGIKASTCEMSQYIAEEGGAVKW